MKNLKAIFQVFKLTMHKIITNPKYYALPLLAILIFIRNALTKTPTVNPIIGTTLSEFLNKLDSGQLIKVLVKQNKLYFMDKAQRIYQASHNLFPKTELFSRLMKGKVEFQDISYSLGIKKFLLIVLISASITLLWSLFSAENPFKKINSVQKPNSTFKDIVGLQDCKVALKQVIEFMKNPEYFKEIGARMRKGIIFYGPSGTGKTSLAKAFAGEANVSFFSCNAAQFRQMYVGMGAKKVRQLFKKARQNAPAVIYIDEIDAMGNRSGGILNNFDGAASQKNTTINQILSEMDGFNSYEMIMVIGSTNKLDLLDQALLRPGRFDLKLKVPLPTQKDRIQILNHYLQNKKHKLSQKFIQQTCCQLKGWSGADLQNLANEAVYTSLRRQSQFIERQDVQKTLKVLL